MSNILQILEYLLKNCTSSWWVENCTHFCPKEDLLWIILKHLIRSWTLFHRPSRIFWLALVKYFFIIFCEFFLSASIKLLCEILLPVIFLLLSKHCFDYLPKVLLNNLLDNFNENIPSSFSILSVEYFLWIIVDYPLDSSSVTSLMSSVNSLKIYSVNYFPKPSEFVLKTFRKFSLKIFELALNNFQNYFLCERNNWDYLRGILFEYLGKMYLSRNSFGMPLWFLFEHQQLGKSFWIPSGNSFSITCFQCFGQEIYH